MSRINPKTDWKNGDFFNIDDYNRIKNNTLDLYNLAIAKYPTFTIEDMGNDVTYSDSFTSSMWNKIVNNFYTIVNNTEFKIPGTQISTIAAGGYLFTTTTLNMFEKQQLHLFVYLLAQA